MRTIASTVGTREEAELATRRLQAAGITPDRIQLKEVSEPEAGVFISVKVLPEQVNAATEILKGGRRSVAEPVPRHDPEVERPRASPHPAQTTTPSAASTSVRSERPVESTARAAPQASGSAGNNGRSVGRLVFMALALAAFGFALGAILGTFI
ncbi:MAG TPA: hypothetical protein VGR19_05310 [Allosphingosinicella sp.]|nr:hypothetical protein [Allosphingosinicella sp.]